MAGVVLIQGTVEYLLFDWSDQLGVLTTLDGTTKLFDVAGPTGYAYYTNQGSTNVGMRQYCLIDTTTSPGGSPSAGGLWLPGDYKIWVKLTAGVGSEKPRVGSFPFTVSAG